MRSRGQSLRDANCLSPYLLALRRRSEEADSVAAVGTQRRAQRAHAERAFLAVQLQGAVAVLGAPALQIPQRAELLDRFLGWAQAVASESRPGLSIQPQVRPRVRAAERAQAGEAAPFRRLPRAHLAERPGCCAAVLLPLRHEDQVRLRNRRESGAGPGKAVAKETETRDVAGTANVWAEGKQGRAWPGRWGECWEPPPLSEPEERTAPFPKSNSPQAPVAVALYLWPIPLQGRKPNRPLGRNVTLKNHRPS